MDSSGQDIAQIVNRGRGFMGDDRFFAAPEGPEHQVLVRGCGEITETIDSPIHPAPVALLPMIVLNPR
jgi:hypothetical protein